MVQHISTTVVSVESKLAAQEAAAQRAETGPHYGEKHMISGPNFEGVAYVSSEDHGVKRIHEVKYQFPTVKSSDVKNPETKLKVQKLENMIKAATLSYMRKVANFKNAIEQLEESELYGYDYDLLLEQHGGVL